MLTGLLKLVLISDVEQSRGVATIVMVVKSKKIGAKPDGVISAR